MQKGVGCRPFSLNGDDIPNGRGRCPLAGMICCATPWICLTGRIGRMSPSGTMCAGGIHCASRKVYAPLTHVPAGYFVISGVTYSRKDTGTVCDLSNGDASRRLQYAQKKRALKVYMSGRSVDLSPWPKVAPICGHCRVAVCDRASGQVPYCGTVKMVFISDTHS